MEMTMMPEPVPVRIAARRHRLVRRPAMRSGARRRPPRLFPNTPLLRFLVLNALGGFAVALLFVGLLLWFDVQGFGSLIARSEAGLLGLAIVTFGMCVTFGGAVMGGAVMLMDYDPPGGPPRGTREDD